MGRTVKIRFVRKGEPIKRATITWWEKPSNEEWDLILRWALGDPNVQLGKATKKLTVNVIITEPTE